MQRCDWVPDDSLMIEYHDKEWGFPLHNDRKLFEFLILDGFQAGLSWSTILKKRENFRRAFAEFDAEKIAKFGDNEVQELLQNKGIIRNKLKISATIKNAKAYLKILETKDSFDQYLWQFVEGKTIINKWKTWKEIPAQTGESEAMSKDLKKHGFSFVGPTICYAFMQAAGMVNDHTVSCFLYEKINKEFINL